MYALQSKRMCVPAACSSMEKAKKSHVKWNGEQNFRDVAFYLSNIALDIK